MSVFKRPSFYSEMKSNLDYQHYLIHIKPLPKINFAKLNRYNSHLNIEELRRRKNDYKKKIIYHKRDSIYCDSTGYNDNNHIRNKSQIDTFYVKRSADIYRTKMNFMRGFYEIAKSKNLSYISATPKVENIPKKKFIYIKNKN